jgi:hypothetical protein
MRLARRPTQCLEAGDPRACRGGAGSCPLDLYCSWTRSEWQQWCLHVLGQMFVHTIPRFFLRGTPPPGVCDSLRLRLCRLRAARQHRHILCADHVYPFQQIHIEVCRTRAAAPPPHTSDSTSSRHHIYYNTASGAAAMPLRRLRTQHAPGCLWQN